MATKTTKKQKTIIDGPAFPLINKDGEIVEGITKRELISAILLTRFAITPFSSITQCERAIKLADELLSKF